MKDWDLQQEYTYFEELWEYKKHADLNRTPKIWDSRADDWEKELAQDGPFRRSLQERVGNAAGYLRSKGALSAGSEVLDIGCGPGWFAAEFARTAGHVTGIDLSPRMLEVGAAHAAALGIDNISFQVGDFAAFDVAALGWNRKFDLVFTSITPAIGTMEALKKSIEISRGYCFNSSFIHWEDELEKQIGQDVFGVEYSPVTDSKGKGFYALFSLLWLMGYFPETSYHLQEQSEYVEANVELATYYAKCYSPDMLADENNVRSVYQYLQEHARPDGTILRQYTRRYGWILWDVRNRMERMPIGRHG